MLGLDSFDTNTSALIKNSLIQRDLKTAQRLITYCTNKTESQAIYDLIFDELLRQYTYTPESIKNLSPGLYLAFVKNLFLSPAIGGDKYSILLPHLMTVLQLLRSQPNPDWTAIGMYEIIIYYIAVKQIFLEYIANDRNLNFSPFYINQLIIALKTSSVRRNFKDIPAVISQYEERLLCIAKDKPLLWGISHSVLLGFIAHNSKLAAYVLTNQNDFLLQCGVFEINKYIFENRSFKKDVKIEVLQVLFAALADPQKYTQAKNILNWLMSGNMPVMSTSTNKLEKNYALLDLITDRVRHKLNVPGSLLYAVNYVKAKYTGVMSTQDTLTLMNEFLSALARAMRKSTKAGNTKAVIQFFEEDPIHLDMLCIIYSFAYQNPKCHTKWDELWEYNNKHGMYQALYIRCLNSYPDFLYRQGLEQLRVAQKIQRQLQQANQHIKLESAKMIPNQALIVNLQEECTTLKAEAEVKLNLAKGYFKEAKPRYSPASLALAVVYTKADRYNDAKVQFDIFIAAQAEESPAPHLGSNIYKHLSEFYQAVLLQDNFDLIYDVVGTLNRIYPDFLRHLEHNKIPPRDLKRAQCYRSTMTEPTRVLKARFLKAQNILTVEDLSARFMQLRIAMTIQEEHVSEEDEQSVQPRGVLCFSAPIASRATAPQPSWLEFNVGASEDPVGPGYPPRPGSCHPNEYE